MKRSKLTAKSLAHILSRLNNTQRALWCGALSFEDRCKASLNSLQPARLSASRGILVDYHTAISPSTQAEERRTFNWMEIETLGHSIFRNGIEKLKCSAYLFQEFQDLLAREIESLNPDCVILDITCLTKVHALAGAAFFATTEKTFDVFLAYSIPENYGFVSNAIGEPAAWRDILIAPLADTAMLFNEASGRGIIMPGHEADRLIIALGEIEPAAGVIVIAEAKRRPDLRQVTEGKNGKTIKQLSRVRGGRWKKSVVGLADFDGLSAIIEEEVLLAQAHEAPVIIFPYGPKSLLFAAAWQLTKDCPDASWFVYPIPVAYDADYSSGVEETLWMQI